MALTSQATKAAEAGMVRFQRRRRRRRADLVRGVISVVVVLAVWQGYVDVAHPSQLVLVAPSTIAQTFWDDSGNGVLASAMQTTMAQFAIGFMVAAVAGIAVGLVMGTRRKVNSYLEPVFILLYVTPPVALAPLLIVPLGFGLEAHVAIIALTAYFPICWNTVDAAREVEADLRVVGTAFGAGALEEFIHILLPGAASGIITGLRFGMAQSLIGAVVADFFGSTSGLGYMIFQAEQAFDTSTIFVGVIVVTGLGLVFTGGLSLLQSRVMRWDTADAHAAVNDHRR